MTSVGHYSSDGILSGVSRGLSIRASCPESSRLAIFCTDEMLPAAEAISNAADEMSSSAVPVIRDGRIPGWIDPSVVTILVSRTGDCHEILEAYDALKMRGCTVCCMASGGELFEKESDPDLKTVMPEGISLSESLGFTMGALAVMVQKSGIFNAEDCLRKAVETVRGALQSYVGVADETCKMLKGGVPAVYTTSDTCACARAWRDMVGNDLSFFGELPEFDHNELVGWSDPNSHAPELQMVVLRKGSRTGLVSIIVSCMTEVLRENGREVIVIDLCGETAMARDLCGFVLGAMVAERLEGC